MSRPEKELCERCGKGVPARRRNSNFCSDKCAKSQRKADEFSAQSEREDQASRDLAEDLLPVISDNGFPRRIRTDLFSPAETAIRAALLAVEEAGADPLLTDAVILLGQAQEKVADFVDRSIRREQR